MTGPRTSTDDAVTGGAGTPGPWRLETDGDTVNDQPCEWPWRIHGANGEEVLDFTGGSEVSWADARLIAAAPQLLAALEEMLALTRTGVHADDRSPFCCRICRSSCPHGGGCERWGVMGVIANFVALVVLVALLAVVLMVAGAEVGMVR